MAVDTVRREHLCARLLLPFVEDCLGLGSGHRRAQSSPFDGAALVETVLALFKHDVSEEDELPFDAGDEVQVISKDDSGWWQGRNVKTGAVGIFPANYTRPKTTKLPPGFRGLVNTQQDL